MVNEAKIDFIQHVYYILDNYGVLLQHLETKKFNDNSLNKVGVIPLENTTLWLELINNLTISDFTSFHDTHDKLPGYLDYFFNYTRYLKDEADIILGEDHQTKEDLKNATSTSETFENLKAVGENLDKKIKKALEVLLFTPICNVEIILEFYLNETTRNKFYTTLSV